MMKSLVIPTTLPPFSTVIPADYIRVLAEWLRLPVTTTSTALLYFYRFDKYRKDPIHQRQYPDLRTLDTLLFATCCVYLATKTTDCSRKVRDILNCAHRALFPDQEQLKPDPIFQRLRDSVLATELALLRILKFELEMELAYWPALLYVRYLFQIHSSKRSSSFTRFSTHPIQPHVSSLSSIPKDILSLYNEPDITHVPATARTVLQIAWMLVSDSYLRSSVLHFPAKHIGLSAVFIALHQLQPSQAPLLHELCDKFGLPTENVERVVLWMVSTHLPERKSRTNVPAPPKLNTPTTPSFPFDSNRFFEFPY